MRIYIANNGETLRQIAKQFQMGLEQLLIQNPSITDPDRNVERLQVRLPSADEPFGIPMCPPSLLPGDLKQWIPLTPLEQMAETEYDVLIVGSGAGGGAALWRLSEQWGNNEKKIGVVEAGDLLLPTHSLNVPTLSFSQARQLSDNTSIPIGEELPEFPSALRKVVFGGGTLFWLTVSPRMSNSEIQNWPISLQEMDYYYDTAERIMKVNKDFSKGSSFTEVLLGRLHRMGLTNATVRPMAVDLEQTKYGMVHSNVFFSSIIFFAYALNRRPVDLAVNARAVKVLSDSGKVVGVEVVTPDKRSFIIKSKKVILSTSTLETPRILLHSGIQGRAIGHYLTSHSGILANGVLNRGDFPEVLGTLSILVPETDNKPFQIEIERSDRYYIYKYEEEPLLKELDIRIFGAGKIESRFENYVDLDPNRKDEYGVPKIQVHYSYSETDKQVIRQTIQGVKHVSSIVGAPLISRNGRPAICLLRPGQELHYTGTCRIGNDPLKAATNPFGEIFGVSGLFVADNSMIPTMSAANPTLTTVALAIRTADHILQQRQD